MTTAVAILALIAFCYFGARWCRGVDSRIDAMVDKALGSKLGAWSDGTDALVKAYRAAVGQVGAA